MILARLLTDDIYRHANGMKHINIINNDGYSALFVVNTPIADNSGVAHAVEHMVFRGSSAFPQPETLFQLTSLTDAKINASTFAETTYFHCQSQCEHTFMLAINYLLNGLYNPVFNAEDLRFEIHDGNDKGVIYQELIGIEQANQGNTEDENTNKSEFCYGGISTSIGELTLNDLTTFHQRFYQASNITLVTANADIEQVSNLIALLPKQSTQVKVALDEYKTQSQANEQENTLDNENTDKHQKKYSQEINRLITIYHQWLQDPYYQEIDDYNEIESTQKTLVAANTLQTSPNSNLISALATLSNQLTNAIKNEKATNIDVIKSSLPGLFTKLYQQGIKQLNNNELYRQDNNAFVSDLRNALWLTSISDNEQVLATITSYIISAYPTFLAPRCQGACYATQALVIENSTYLAIYSAFDVNIDVRLKEISNSLKSLSQDISFISMSLSLAKIKYCRSYKIKNSQVNNITENDVTAYLLRLVS
jgi:hypothetical protein